QPPGSLDNPNQALLALISGKYSVRALAAGYQGLLQDLIARLSTDRLITSPDAASHARLANWLIAHPDLFVTEKAAIQKVIADHAAAYFASRTQLLGRIKHESRLAPAIMDGSGVDEHVFVRGSPKTLGGIVPRRFLEALTGPGRLGVARGSGRL